MESQLVIGFNEATSNEVFGESNYKLVPWISWDDWRFVKESLFSSSPASIDEALRRISAWRSRGCLPAVIEVTGSIVETQQKDFTFRDDLSEGDFLADDMLTMLYCMSIMRLVNGIVEKTRKRNEISIAEAADVIGIPRMLIDIRHECSHRDLPSLRLVRLASTKALDWLKAYYWEPQNMAIPRPSDRTTNFRKEIKSKIHELAFSLDERQTTRSGSSVVKGKSKRHSEQLRWRGIFPSLMAAKIQSSKPSGSKKHVNKALKNLMKLYSLFPHEVISILLEFLLKELESADVAEVANVSGAYNARLDNWKPLILKLSNKEPEMLLSLLKTVSQMFETQKDLKDASEHLKRDGKSGIYQTENLSCLFEWLVGNLKDLKLSRRKTTNAGNEISLPKSDLLHLLRKCLVDSSLGNNHLTSAASILAKLAGNHTLLSKLNKLASIHTLNTNIIEETALADPESFYNYQETTMREAANKLELLKQKLSQKRNSKTETKIRRWAVAKSWKPCPIGMLPSVVGSSGVLPVLDAPDENEEAENSEEGDERTEVNRCGGKREAECSMEVLDDNDVKKRKMSSGFDDEERILESVNGRLMEGEVGNNVTEDEVVTVASRVRIMIGLSKIGSNRLVKPVEPFTGPSMTI